MEVSGRKEDSTQNKSRDGGQPNILCQPCHGDGDSVQAEGYCETCNEYLCTSCMKVHQKLSATKNHVIKSKQGMPKVPAQTDPCTDPCAIHKTEIVKFYCKDHDSVGCGNCMVLDHKSCKVLLVSDVSSNYGLSEELQAVRNKIEALAKEISSCKHDIKDNLKAADEMKATVIEEIKKFRKELNCYLDQAEEQLLQTVTEIKTVNVSLHKKLQDECVAMANEIKEFQSKLNQYSSKMNMLFITSKLAQKMLKTSQESVKAIAFECQKIYCKFEPTKELVAILGQKIPLGNLSMQKKLANMKADFVKKINVTNNTETCCWITGLAKISGDEILLVDNHNNSLKILNMKQNEIVSSIQVPSKPWDVTAIKSGLAAVTVPAQGRIVFIKKEKRLSICDILIVRNGCLGIDHRKGVIAVSFSYPPAIQILNIKGDILYEVPDHVYGLFVDLCYIAFSADGKELYVTDPVQKAVNVILIEGEITKSKKHRALNKPMGIAVATDGTVIVCCQSTSDEVKMIIPNTNDIQTLYVQNVEAPCSILLCKEQNKLYISEHFFSRANNLFVKMFDLK